MKKSWCVEVIERKGVRGDRPINYFFPTEIRSSFCLPEGVMAVEVPQNERFLEEEEMEGERKSVLLSVEEEQIRGA